MNPRFRHRNRKKIWLAFPIGIGLAFLLVWFVQWLWNILLPEILGVKSITYWQAFGILILSKVLFGGFRCGGGKRHFRDKWNKEMPQMTDDDKERFREEWRKRFGDRCKFGR